MSDTKQKILDATSELFIEGGAEGLSARAVAKKAGLSTIGIYSHFNGMQGLLDALYIEGFEKVIDAMDVPIEELGLKTAIILAMQNYLQFAEKYDAHYRLMFGSNNGGYEPSEQAKEVGARGFAKLTKLVSSVLPDNASLTEKQSVAMQVWAMTHGYVSLKHHPISEMVDMSNWKENAVDAVLLHFEAIERTQQGS